MWAQCLRAFREEGGPYLLAKKLEAGGGLHWTHSSQGAAQLPRTPSPPPHPLPSPVVERHPPVFLCFPSLVRQIWNLTRILCDFRTKQFGADTQ